MATNWIERLAGSTRSAVLALLRRSRHTISELSQRLGITDNAVRTHIAALQRDGLVEQVGVRRDARGKPAHVFDLTGEAEELFPKAYAPVLSAVISELERRQGEAETESLLRAVGAAIGDTAASPALELRSRVDAAAALLTSLGAELRVEPVADGYEVLGHGCPLNLVVRDHHATCVIAESLLASATGAVVTEHCHKGDRSRCAFHIAAAAAAAAAPSTSSTQSARTSSTG
jgi:predicted ArsR family transcriptional regulator